MSINEDYFFPQTAEGRGSKVDTLPGGTNLGEIDDLKFFTEEVDLNGNSCSEERAINHLLGCIRNENIRNIQYLNKPIRPVHIYFNDWNDVTNTFNIIMLFNPISKWCVAIILLSHSI